MQNSECSSGESVEASAVRTVVQSCSAVCALRPACSGLIRVLFVNIVQYEVYIFSFIYNRTVYNGATTAVNNEKRANEKSMENALLCVVVTVPSRA